MTIGLAFTSQTTLQLNVHQPEPHINNSCPRNNNLWPHNNNSLQHNTGAGTYVAAGPMATPPFIDELFCFLVMFWPNIVTIKTNETKCSVSLRPYID